jgi:hypothetical protein
MNQAQRSLCRALVLSCIVIGYASRGFGQASDPKSAAVVDQIMATALARCYSTGTDGFKRIHFVTPTNEEFAQVKALGQRAIVPLARHLDLQPKNDFTQLFAVKFLMAIGGSSTLGPLKRAFAQDQWEVTRAAALSGMFSVSPDAARPYVEAALTDKSHLVQQRAQEVAGFLSKAKQITSPVLGDGRAGGSPLTTPGTGTCEEIDPRNLSGDPKCIPTWLSSFINALNNNF